MKSRLLTAGVMVVALCVPRMAEACGGMAAFLRAMLARLDSFDAPFTPPPAVAPAPTPPTQTAQESPRPDQPTAPPVAAFVPPPPPPPPMVQLSPGALNGGLNIKSQVIESDNEQVTQDLHEGLVIS